MREYFIRKRIEAKDISDALKKGKKAEIIDVYLNTEPIGKDQEEKKIKGLV